MKKLLFPLAAVALLAACTSNDEPLVEPAKPIVLDASQTRALSADNAFAWKLAYALQGENSSDNLFFSPLSISMDLSMVANGAAGATLEEMIGALGDGGVASLEDLNSLNQRLADALVSVDPSTKLSLANSIWLNTGMVINEGFRNAVSEYYGGSLFETDMEAKGKEEINKWVDKHTWGLIPQFLSDNPGDLALVNATAFEGKWKYPFNSAATYETFFYTYNGSPSRVSMMKSKSIPSRYVKEGDNQLFELPYGNGAFSMVIILPDAKTGVNLKTLFADNSYNELISKLNRGYGYDLSVEMPRFRMEQTFSLEEVLKQCGMPGIFGTKADFSNLAAGAKITDVIHKTFVEVNEEGTKAAAATSTTMVIAPTPVVVKCDHPFAFVIKENSTGAILFIGVVNKL